MKVVIHTRRVLEERWDVPAGTAEMTDEDLLAVCRGWRAGAQARREGIHEFDVAEPYVFSRGEPDLQELGRQLSDARAATSRVMDAARESAVRLLDAGSASERQVAAALGVDRNTVRGWRRKPAQGG